MSIRSVVLGATLATLTLTGAAQAALIVTGSVGGAPTGVTRENFDNLALGTGSPQNTSSGIQVLLTPNAAVVQGSVGGQYAAPFLSGGNGAGFGPGGTNQANGVDTTRYLTSGSTGATAGTKVELLLPGLQKYFGLLWGSVDDYNTLEFFNGNVSVGTVTGINVTASPNGNQGVQGTLYVNIDSTLDFNRVVATSTQFAFEFDNVAFNRQAVPEPASLALFGAGLFGLGLVRRRRAAAQAA